MTPTPMTPSRGGAVVTGAGRGLGRQIAELLANRGYKVLVTDVDEVYPQLPHFALDDIAGLADFVLDSAGLPRNCSR